MLHPGDLYASKMPTATTTVPIDLQNADGETLSVTHTLRLRQVDDRTVQPIAGTTGSRLQTITVTRDGNREGETVGEAIDVAP